MKDENLSNPRVYHQSLRLRDYDYSSVGAYFLTLCTQSRICLFGEIIGEEMILNTHGEIVRDELLLTPKIRPTLELDAYTVMPNHLHMIIWIKNCSGDLPVARSSESNMTRTKDGDLKPASIGSFVAGFKSTVTTQINKLRRTPGLPVWQRNYYEHVIRNEFDLNEIREYIVNNPLKWLLDRENPGFKIIG